MRKDSLIMPAILLCIICLVTTGLVALTYVSTQEARDRQAELTANANRRELCPDAAGFEPVSLTDDQLATGLTEAFEAVDADGAPLAWLISAAEKGYGGDVPVLIVIDLDGQITGVKVLGNNETPGLGKKVADKAFIGQFTGQSAENVFAVKTAAADQVLIDAVTGATISSRAVTNAVNAVLAFYQSQLAEVN